MLLTYHTEHSPVEGTASYERHRIIAIKPWHSWDTVHFLSCKPEGGTSREGISLLLPAKGRYLQRYCSYNMPGGLPPRHYHAPKWYFAKAGLFEKPEPEFVWPELYPYRVFLGSQCLCHLSKTPLFQLQPWIKKGNLLNRLQHFRLRAMCLEVVSILFIDFHSMRDCSAFYLPCLV